MCGIAGFCDLRSGYDRINVITRMIATLHHRGPDGTGIWVQATEPVVFGHKRLTILDLSEAGSQPMSSQDKNSVITYNGEIYNFQDLKNKLIERGYNQFRSSSDTEILVEGISQFGVDAVLQMIRGMFAFAVWNHSTKTLTLARDHCGIKPLYWALFDGVLLFASELKALRAHPKFVDSINPHSLELYCRYGYIPGPHSLFKNVFKLQPGHKLTLRAGKDPVIEPYWDIQTILTSRPVDALSDSEYLRRLESVLLESVHSHMISDVPIGAFLSGGVDSSTVVALMQKVSTSPVKTYSIGFHDPKYNEAEYARTIARHLKTDHTELVVNATDALNAVPLLPKMYCEPFSDSSQIPTFMVSKLASQELKVVLTGDGGDELFGGYPRYFKANQFFSISRLIPDFMRGPTELALVATSDLMAACSTISPIQSIKTSLLSLSEKSRLASTLLSHDFSQFYDTVNTYWSGIISNCDRNSVIPFSKQFANNLTNLETMQVTDFLRYLPDDILTKVDRAAMFCSLEGRVPLLDKNVIEFACSLPLDQKVRKGTGKYILKKLLEKFVPKELIYRPKMGFSVPLHRWIRGELKDWTEDLLSEKKLGRSGLFDVKKIRNRHLDIQKNQTTSDREVYKIWTILMYQAWEDHWNSNAWSQPESLTWHGESVHHPQPQHPC